MFVIKLTVYINQNMSTDEMMEKIDLYIDVYLDDWNNILTKGYELSYIDKTSYYYTCEYEPRAMQTLVSKNPVDRQKFLEMALPTLEKMKQKLAIVGVVFEIQQEDNVTDIIGVELTL